MKKWMLIAISFLFVLCISPAWANTDEKAAQTTIENWFAAMKKNNLEEAGSYLAPQFVSVHTDGVVRNKNQELKLIKNLNMTNYELSHFKFSQHDNVMVVTYVDKGIEKIDNKTIGSAPATRMAVLQRDDGKWLIIAYANMDKIG